MTAGPPIRLRQATSRDAVRVIEYIHRLAAEPGVDILLAPGEFQMSAAEEARYLSELAEAENSVCLLAESGRHLVGQVSCRGGRRRAVRHTTELGISVDREWRGRGIGSRLLEAALVWARETELVTRIELKVFARNQGAIRLYERFGFQIEGRRRRSIYLNGEYLDDLIMARLL